MEKHCYFTGQCIKKMEKHWTNHVLFLYSLIYLFTDVCLMVVRTGASTPSFLPNADAI